MIYLGGSCSSENRTLMTNIGKAIRELGFKVYCPFELQIENAWDYSQETWSKMVFDKDVEAIDNSNIVIVISVGRISSAGTNWEQGYAYAKGKVVYVFQITDEPTSLMTYNGCTYFINTNTDNVVQRVRDLLQNNLKFETVPFCRTVLT